MNNVSTYVNNICENSTFSVDNITVEHRSNNPKRDFLFVNKAQCMHIPNKPHKIIDMCKQLANMVNDEVKAKNILAIAFAETATAIGNIVADNLNNCSFIMTTTREKVNFAKELITFSEEHSHATEQKLLSYDCMDIDKYDYILFIEDEISTGKTILNFIDAFDKIRHKPMKYGVASICNWQNWENREKYIRREIKTFYLIGGNLINPNMKMKNNNYKTEPRNSNDSFDSCYRGKMNIQTSLFMTERLGHKPNRDFTKFFDDIVRRLEYNHVQKSSKIRVVGTEEFKYIPIKLGEYLENKGYDVICQSTTRSPIDVMDGGEIKSKYLVPSVYEAGRKNYIYNIGNNVDLTIFITDSLISDDIKSVFVKIFGQSMYINTTDDRWQHD